MLALPRVPVRPARAADDAVAPVPFVAVAAPVPFVLNTPPVPLPVLPVPVPCPAPFHAFRRPFPRTPPPRRPVNQMRDPHALDRGLRLADKRSFPADRPRWLAVRDEIYEEVMHKGWNPERQAFVQDSSDHVQFIGHGEKPRDLSALMSPPRNTRAATSSAVGRTSPFHTSTYSATRPAALNTSSATASRSGSW